MPRCVLSRWQISVTPKTGQGVENLCHLNTKKALKPGRKKMLVNKSLPADKMEKTPQGHTNWPVSAEFPSASLKGKTIKP